MDAIRTSEDIPLRRNTNIECVTRRDLNRRPYHIICNLSNDKFIRLGPVFFKLFMAIPKGIPYPAATEFCLEHGKDMDRETAERFIHVLLRTGLLIPESSSIIDDFVDEPTNEPWLSKIGRKVIHTAIPIKHADIFIDLVYKYVGHFFFNRYILLALMAFGGTGLFLFFQQSTLRIVGGDFQPFTVSMVPFIWIGVLFSVFLHEMGHALTCRHFKRPVSALGFMLYLGIPGAFVDTSSAYMLPRRQRIAIDLAGVGVNIIVVATTGFIAWLCGNTVFTVVFYIGLINAVVVFFNLIPFAKYDGYYALTDLFDYPNMRDAAISTVFSRRIWHGMAHSQRLSREETVLFGFGLVSVAFTAVMLGLLLLYVYVRLRAALPYPLNEYIPVLAALFLAVAMMRFARAKIKKMKKTQK